MKHFHKKRMQKLIDFLRQMRRKKFDFSLVAAKKPSCTTVGCAMGWTPVVFPGLVKFTDSDYEPSTIEDKNKLFLDVATRGQDSVSGYRSVAEKLFGLTSYEAEALFTPNTELIEIDENGYSKDHVLSGLPETATPKQVAARLEKFLRWKEKNSDVRTSSW